MARLIGRALAGRRFIPPMECALACLLVALSVIGSTMDLDYKVRSAATGFVAAVYHDHVRVVRGVLIPKETMVRVVVRQPLGGVQAQAGRNP